MAGIVVVEPEVVMVAAGLVVRGKVAVLVWMLVPSKTLKTDTKPDAVGRGLNGRVEGVPAARRVRRCGRRGPNSSIAVTKETVRDKSFTDLD